MASKRQADQPRPPTEDLADFQREHQVAPRRRSAPLPLTSTGGGTCTAAYCRLCSPPWETEVRPYTSPAA